jgi:hypothetical protein
VFYTPKVINSPRQIEQDIQDLRERLRSIRREPLYPVFPSAGKTLKEV